MRFIANSTTILKALSKCAGVISNATVLSVLEDFLFELDGNRLTITATDLETMITLSLEVAEAKGAGAICIPAKKLQEYLKTLTEQPVIFDIDVRDLSLTLSTASGKSKIGCEKADEFPKALEPGDSTSFEMPAAVLIDGIDQTLFAVSSDTLRPAMTGVLFDLNGDRIRLVATDAHRLVQVDFTTVSAPENTQFVVPKRALQQLKNVMPSDETLLQVAYNASHLFVEVGYVKVVSRLIDARFPDYAAVIPKANPYRLVVNRVDFVATLRRTGIFANKSTKQVMLSLSGNTLQLQACDLDFNYEATETIPASWTGDNMKIAFNGDHLSEMVANLEGEEVAIMLHTPTRAALLSPSEASEWSTVLMLSMPLMVGA